MSLLVSFFSTLLLICLPLASLFALLLVVAPLRALHFNAAANRWVSLRRAMRPLEIPRQIDPHFYRHHQHYGALMLLGSAYTVYAVAFFDLSSGATQFFLDWGHAPPVAAWLGEAVTIFLFVNSIGGFICGNLIFHRPSLLKPIEAHANRWVSTRRLLSALDRDYYPADSLLIAYPRQIGLLLLIAILSLLFLILGHA
jgi:hypothetical protein